MSDIDYFEVGRLETYIYPFKHKNIIYDEYIHCIIKERINDWDGTPRKIKVSQIHNLQDYYSNPKIYNNYTERTLNTDELTVHPNYRVSRTN